MNKIKPYPNNPEPVTLRLARDDVAYIVEALLDASDKRRERPGRIHERIADHLEDLALNLHDARPDPTGDDMNTVLAIDTGSTESGWGEIDE